MNSISFMQAFRRTGSMFSIALALGVLIVSGCEPGQGGADAPAVAPREPAEIGAAVPAGALSEEMLGEPVQVTGEVVQQCPASGCWFKVKAEGGETFIDLVPSDIRLSENHVGQQARVTGKVIKRGSELAVEATEVEFEPPGGELP